MKYLKNYDFIFVGAGLTNATIAHTIASHCGVLGNKLRLLVIDKRDHVGGNCYTETKNGIDVHKYGAHIFHTSDENTYNYITQFGAWVPFVNQPIAVFTQPDGTKRMYNMPFNMNTFVQLFPGLTTPAEIKAAIKKEIDAAGITEPKNLAEQAISMVGTTIFNTLVKGYTEKQWGRKCEDLPASIIKRLPVRYTFDNNYFTDKYQMIPLRGYTSIINEMFRHTCGYPGIRLDTMLGTSYKQLQEMGIKGNKVFYSGGIDEFYDYQLGALKYRSVKFKEKTFKTDNVQGCPVCNYTSTDVPYTRSIEHKWFCPHDDAKGSIVSYEYSSEWKKGMEPYYPVNDKANQELYASYKQLHTDMQAKSVTKVTFVGRLGTYSYMDMDDCIMAAREIAFLSMI
jgi:UDP-galactopyranose mutase